MPPRHGTSSGSLMTPDERRKFWEDAGMPELGDRTTYAPPAAPVAAVSVAQTGYSDEERRKFWEDAGLPELGKLTSPGAGATTLPPASNPPPNLLAGAPGAL